MTHDTTPASPAATEQPAPSIPSFFAIMREALRLYRRRFWAYFCVTGIAQAATAFLLLVIVASARSLGPVPTWLSSLCRFMVEDIRSAPGMVAVVFCLEGLAVPALVALALADARGARVNATEAFIGTLPRLHSFLVAWLPASLLIGVPMLAVYAEFWHHVPHVAVIAVTGVFLYVGVSLMEPVFVAERRGLVGALWRSVRLSWRRGAWSRLMALMLLPCAVWPVTAYLTMFPLQEARFDFIQSTLSFSMLALVTALLLPLFMLFKAILYRHAVLLYSPRQAAEPAPAESDDARHTRLDAQESRQ